MDNPSIHSHTHNHASAETCEGCVNKYTVGHINHSCPARLNLQPPCPHYLVLPLMLSLTSHQTQVCEGNTKVRFFRSENAGQWTRKAAGHEISRKQEKKPEFQIDLLGSCSLDVIYTLENAQQHSHNCFVHPVINEKGWDILLILKDEMNHFYHFPLWRVYSQSQTGQYSGNMAAAAELSSNAETLNIGPVDCIYVDLWTLSDWLDLM